MRTAPFPQTDTNWERMDAKHSGTIVKMTVLRGTPLKGVGDRIQTGEPLVGNWIEDEKGGQVRGEIIARVRIACAWAGVVEAETEEEAFAKAYLDGGFTPFDTLLDVECAPVEGGYHVTIAYETVEKINL